MIEPEIEPVKGKSNHCEQLNKIGDNLYASQEQEMLLKASLFRGNSALHAWQEWKKSINIEDEIDNGSFRLLPLLFQNLRAYKVSDPLMERLKGVYRQTWYKNQKLFHDTGKILKQLHKTGVNTLIMKGGALSILTYQDLGVRPMADVDVMVPFSQIILATNTLKQLGWEPNIYPESLETLKYRISLQYKNQSGEEFDLHWFPYIEFNREFSEDIWDHSVQVKLGNEKTAALSETDCLIHVIIHGTLWNPEPPIRWIADAMSILNTPGLHLDWERFIIIIKNNRISLQIGNALRYLKSTYHAGIPDTVIETISRIPVSMVERISYKYSLRNPNTLTNRLGYIPILYLDFIRFNRHSQLLWSTIKFPKYLQYIYNMDKLSDVFSYLAAALYRKIKKTIKSEILKKIA